MFATVSQWGNSGGIRVPKAILESLHISLFSHSHKFR